MVLLFLSVCLLLGLTLHCGIVISVLVLGLECFLVVDWASILFLFTLFSLSSSVLVWSYYYMDTTSVFASFIKLLMLFLLSILGLVLSGNLLTLFFFWDLLGFSSFFLVLWYRSRSSISGAALTGLVNRFGDCLFLILLGVVFSGGGSSFFASCLLFLLAMTKSAQLPFSTWLPAAMAAPTPVSSLVHSSTLVTAGVYLLYRFSSYSSPFLVSLGLVTTLFAGLSAYLESDLKKIVALSTLSQLGLIFTSLGLGLKSLTFLHLNLHASSKALLFLAVGMLIHSNYGSQEFRFAGQWGNSSLLVHYSMCVSCFSMCGITCLSGWVSKDYILSGCYSSSHSNFVLTSFLIGIMLTVSYSLRLAFSNLSCNFAFVAQSSTNFLPLVAKFPLCLVFGLVVVQGLSVNVNSYPLFAVLSPWALVTLIASVFGGWILFYYSPISGRLILQPLGALGLPLAAASSMSVSLGYLRCLDASLSTGVGSSSFYTAVVNVKASSLYLSRVCALLLLAFLV